MTFGLVMIETLEDWLNKEIKDARNALSSLYGLGPNEYYKIQAEVRLQTLQEVYVKMKELWGI